MSHETRRGSYPPPPELRAAVLAALSQSSDERLSRELNIGRAPLLRIAAGLPVRQGTIELARIRLGVPAPEGKDG